LRITKQSLARVLKQLIESGHIVQVTGTRDRRQRELYPTAEGRALALALAAPQSRRIAAALNETGGESRAAVEAFLKAIVDPALRDQIDRLPGHLPGRSSDR
jgi:DNA-binding MarR family transcriptional regulator